VRDRVTLIDDARVVEIAARVERERVRLDQAALRDALGWEVHDGLLCSDAMCIPLADGPTPANRTTVRCPIPPGRVAVRAEAGSAGEASL
jgi:hypothetical protein